MVQKRASNIEVKKINRNQIFRYVNKCSRVSKPDIAFALRISMPTILQNINELIDQGLVKEVGEFKSTGGRKAVAIASVQDSHYAIGIDITRNHIGLVLTDLSGEVLQHMKVYQPYTNEPEYYRKLADITSEYKERWGVAQEKLLGLGISIPGIVDPENDRILFSHALGISNIPCGVFSQFMTEPTLFINDANAAGIAEIHNAEERYNAVYLSLSNSVGGAIIEQRQSFLNDHLIGDKLYLGDNWRSGEFGHVTLVPGGIACYCGKNGCLDAYCSAISLAKHTGGKLETFFEEIGNGNVELNEVWKAYLNHLAIYVNNLRMIFDCRVILGGYVGSFIEPHIQYLKEETSKLNTFECDASYIQPCRYRVEASALGAALQHIEAFISTI